MPKQKHVVRSHHRRPYRGRHIVMLGLAGLLIGISCLEIGVLIGAQRQTAVSGVVAGKSTERGSATQVVPLSGGLQLTYDSSVYARTGSFQDAGKPLTIRPLIAQDAGLAAARMRVFAAPFAGFEPDVEQQQVAEVREQVGGQQFYARTYQLTPSFTGSPSYAVVWTGVNSGTIAIVADGLTSPVVPTVLREALAGIGPVLAGSAGPQVKGDATALSATVLSDLVSPSVVRIYHVICGKLYVNDALVGGDKMCDSATGSGFFVNNDGYIATNGHVVVSSPTDIFANMLTNDPVLLAQFLADNGLSVTQLSTIADRPDLMASLINMIYDAPEGTVRMEDSQEAVFVALGNEPLKISAESGPDAVFATGDTDYVARATVTAYDYSSRDMLRIAQGDERGFVSSDVALIKVEKSHTPALPILQRKATQDESVTLFGFPADAENDLVSPNVIAPSVTHGTISSIRLAAGASGTLYQSDADASRGSSGGPAVTADGKVLGILTYRFASSEPADAAKSYIRDIGDLTALAKRNDVTLQANDSVQQAWSHGVTLFTQHHFKAAIGQFRTVKQAYPAHRLAGDYIDAATAAIEAGDDIPQNAATIYFGSLTIGVIAFVSLMVLMIRHYAHHRIWKHMHTGRIILHHAALTH